MGTRLRALAAIAVLALATGVLGYAAGRDDGATPPAALTATPSAPSGSSPTSTPDAAAPISHPTGPRDVVFRATRTYPAWEQRPEPIVEEMAILYGDGLLLINAGLGAPVPRWWQVWLTEDGVQALLGRVVQDAALLDQPALSEPRPGSPGTECVTCAEYSYSVHARGRTNEVRVLCSGCETAAPPERAALERLRKYVWRLGQAVFAPSEVLAWGTFESGAIHVGATVEHSDSPPPPTAWPEGLATPFEGGVTYCGADMRTVREFIENHGGMFFDGRTLYATPYEYLRPDQEGWAVCGLSAASPEAQAAPPLPAIIDSSNDPAHVVFGVTWPIGGNPYPPMLPTHMSDSIAALYGDGTLILRGVRRGAYLVPAGDSFVAVHLSPDGMRRLAGNLARITGLPARFNPNCVDCGSPTLVLDLGPHRWTSSPDWSQPEPLTSEQAETLYGTIDFVESIQRHLAPGEIVSIEDYAPVEIWVEAFSDVPGGPEAAEWPALLGAPRDYGEPRLLCGDEGPAARAALDEAGSAWSAMFWEGTRYAVRYRPAFPDETRFCRDEDAVITHPDEPYPPLVRVFTTPEILAGPFIRDRQAVMVLDWDGTLYAAADQIGGGAGRDYSVFKLSEAGIQRVLRAALIDGRAFSQPGSVPAGSEVCDECPRARIETLRRAFEPLTVKSHEGTLPARAARFIAWANAIDEGSFEPGEVLSSGPFEPQAVLYRTFGLGGGGAAWPASLPSLGGILDDQRRLACGTAARELLAALRPRKTPTLEGSGLTVWVTAVPMLPGTFSEAQCGQVWEEPPG